MLIKKGQFCSQEKSLKDKPDKELIYQMAMDEAKEKTSKKILKQSQSHNQSNISQDYGQQSTMANTRFATGNNSVIE